MTKYLVWFAVAGVGALIGGLAVHWHIFGGFYPSVWGTVSSLVMVPITIGLGIYVARIPETFRKQTMTVETARYTEAVLNEYLAVKIFIETILEDSNLWPTEKIKGSVLHDDTRLIGTKYASFKRLEALRERCEKICAAHEKTKDSIYKLTRNLDIYTENKNAFIEISKPFSAEFEGIWDDYVLGRTDN